MKLFAQCGLAGTPSRSPPEKGEGWWRRRESNPRPKSLSARRVHALSASFWIRPRNSERTRCAGN